MADAPAFLTETPLRGDAMDALSDVLRIMRLKGGVFLHGAFSHPWCISVKVAPQSCSPYLGETAHVIPYHYVLEGQMRIRIEDGLEIALNAGESIMFPRNDKHLLGSDLARAPVESRDYVARPIEGSLLEMRLDGRGPRTRIVCGFLGTADVRGNPVVNALPAALRLDVRDGSAGAWVSSMFHHAAEQIAAGRPGSEVLMSRLSELLFVEAIQRYVDTLPDKQVGWLMGLKDAYVSRALALMHARVAESWTVEALGKEVGLSRSALADRFGEVLGLPPMQYLANWRIHVAAHELADSNKSIGQVAQDVGYESEASFTRAFKRVMETPPATWRRRRARGSSPATTS
jgi:AraC-like DNA-binding protein